MNITGLITEYNPFHYGHLYHLKKAKELTNADYLVVVMSGDFVQRGEPALIDKYVRAEMALACGADLVLELPAAYAAGSAEYFAKGAATLLHKLGVVDALCFGSECGDINVLQNIASVCVKESTAFLHALKEQLKAGLSYPAAYAKSVLEVLPSNYSKDQYASVLNHPNNILGIEYTKALTSLNSTIQPYTFLREGSGYHEADLSGSFSSATAIRNTILEEGSLAPIKKHVPEPVYEILNREYKKTFPVCLNDFSMVMHYVLTSKSTIRLFQHQDISEDLANKITSSLKYYESLNQFIELLHTKDLTKSRVSRSLVHLLLGISKQDMTDYTDGGTIGYARVLGMREGIGEFTSALKTYSSIPLITKPSTAKNVLSSPFMQMLNQDIFASHIYQTAVVSKYGTLLPREYERQLVKI